MPTNRRDSNENQIHHRRFNTSSPLFSKNPLNGRLLTETEVINYSLYVHFRLVNLILCVLSFNKNVIYT